jgi:alcohol dehydrogenase
VGTITEVGSSVTNFKVGDRVIISCIKSCGACANCKQGLYSHCLGDEGLSGLGWVLGHLINGTQAEFVRIPYADNSLYLMPAGLTDNAAVMLSDILPTGFEIGVQYGAVKPGDVVAVIGAGPIGLAAIITASLYGAARVISIDLDANRLEKSREFGATDTVVSGSARWKEEVFAMTDGAGVDVAIEAVGVPLTFEMATQIVRPGGHVANIGVHGKSVSLEIQNLWIQNISISMGLVNTNTTPLLLNLVMSKKIQAEKFATHFFNFDEFIAAYDTFSRAAETKALKVIITNKK